MSVIIIPESPILVIKAPIVDVFLVLKLRLRFSKALQTFRACGQHPKVLARQSPGVLQGLGFRVQGFRV